jgi:hypothetical protein
MAGMPGIGDSGSVDNHSLRAVRGLLDWPVHPAWARDSGSAALVLVVDVVAFGSLRVSAGIALPGRWRRLATIHRDQTPTNHREPRGD